MPNLVGAMQTYGGKMHQCINLQYLEQRVIKQQGCGAPDLYLDQTPLTEKNGPDPTLQKAKSSR